MSLAAPSLSVCETGDLGSVEGGFNQRLDRLDVQLRRISNDYLLVGHSLIEDLVEDELVLFDVLSQVDFIPKRVRY